MNIAVFGHTNPDTDAITSALVYASFLNRTGVSATAYRLGDLNNETTFVLERVGVSAPEKVSSLPAKTPVALTDHNEAAQSISNLGELEIKYIVDHHKVGALSSSEPIYLRFEPVGCTGTILTKLFIEHNLHLEGWEATLLLSAIVSDTLYFRSPTTTPQDREIAAYLSPITGIANLEAYSLEMFAAKSNLGDMAAAKILTLDYKVFTFGGKPYGLGVLETTNPGYALGRKAELLQAMQDEKDESNLEGVLLSIVDILNETNHTLILSDSEAALVKGAFGVDTADDLADLGNRISRKKQVVPTLEKYFA